MDEIEISRLREWIQSRPEWSRKRIAKEICEQWNWRNNRGRLKDFAARSLLLKLEAEGRIQLPPLQENKRRAPRKIELLAQWEEPSVPALELSELRPLRVSVVQAGTQPWKRWAFYLHRFHYLGLRVVGEADQ